MSYNNAGYAFQTNNKFEPALDYFLNALKIQREINDKFGIAGSLNNAGTAYQYLGNVAKAMEFYQESLKIRIQLKDKQSIANSINNIAFIYQNQGDIHSALEYYHRSLKIREQLGDKKGLANSFNNIAAIYHEQNYTQKALEYYNKALKIQEEINNQRGIANTCNNIGTVYQNTTHYPEALVYLNRSLKIYEQLKDQQGYARSLSNIGAIFTKQGNFKTGLEYQLQSLKLREEINDKIGITNSLYNIGNMYQKSGDASKALPYALRSLTIAQELSYPRYISDAAYLLKNIYQKQNQAEKALQMYELFITMRDSINNVETRKASIKKQFQYEYDKKVVADSLRASQEKKVTGIKIAAQDAEIRREKTQRYALYIGLILVVVFAGFMFNRFKVTQKQKQVIEIQKAEVESQKHLVEVKQKEILDSILYAKRLQEALLPTETSWHQQLPNSFVLYKPKDIVAGDFYWMEKINDHLFFSVADCTGHGVPGALVSVVCCNALNRTVLEFGITEPAKILDKTRELVITTFEKSDKEVKDGMDISLCCLNTKTNKLQWAGANNSLWYIKYGRMEQLQGDKQPVGKHMQQASFTHHELQLNKGDQLFMYTDGFADQFGGEHGKKYKRKRLNEILLANYAKPNNEQKKLIEGDFENWKGNLEQVDDVCVVGIKI